MCFPSSVCVPLFGFLFEYAPRARLRRLNERFSMREAVHFLSCRFLFCRGVLGVRAKSVSRERSFGAASPVRGPLWSRGPEAYVREIPQDRRSGVRGVLFGAFPFKRPANGFLFPGPGARRVSRFALSFKANHPVLISSLRYERSESAARNSIHDYRCFG